MLKLHSILCLEVLAWGIQMHHCIPSGYATDQMTRLSIYKNFTLTSPIYRYLGSSVVSRVTMMVGG